MNFHVLTLFPEMIEQGMNTSIIGRAIAGGYLSVDAINIRDYAFNKHQKVDDYPYGGGAGMLMQAEPVYLAYQSIEEKIGYRPRVVYLTPQGSVFNQTMAKDFAKEQDLVFLCGHYEGIDERVLEEVVTDFVSIGDYVLTGGELPAMVMMDAVSRMVPGVLSNQESGETESFAGNLLEYPQYSRPEEWHGKRFLLFFYQDIMPTSKRGEENSLSCVQQRTGRIFSKRQILPTKSGIRSASGRNSGKKKKKRTITNKRSSYEDIRFLL